MKNISEKGTFHPMVAPRLFEQALLNENWKLAFATGKYAQVVFMNVSPNTNPKNEIGMEIHPFDQVIIIVKGNAKVVLNEEETMAKEGDMIFIPQGTSHNVINVSQEEALKIVSFYSNTDIPANSTYKRKEDESGE
jgi:quercetin dioxygenase-like cupin family protein